VASALAASSGIWSTCEYSSASRTIKHADSLVSGGNTARLQVFLIVSTCFLYLVAAGLFSKGVWFFENHAWNKAVGGDASEVGSGPGSYDIRQSVWHVNCCNPEINGGGGWGIFNSLFGWTNSATYGSVLAYNLYWVVVIVAFFLMRYKETNGHLPFVKAKALLEQDSESESQVGSKTELAIIGKTDKAEDIQPGTSTVREITA
jgi:high-affinity iron transporter